jgi:hypothetical protein
MGNAAQLVRMIKVACVYVVIGVGLVSYVAALYVVEWLVKVYAAEEAASP